MIRPGRALVHAGLLALAACGGGEFASDEEARAGERAAAVASAMRIVTAEELTSALAEYGGDRLLVLNLWATWCTPCVAELPHFSRVAASRDDVDFLGLSADWAASTLPDDEDRAKVAGLWAKIGVSFDTWYLQDTLESLTETLSLEDGVLPQTHLLRQGTILASHSGDLGEQELRDWIDAALES